MSPRPPTVWPSRSRSSTRRVGDIAGNPDKARAARAEAGRAGRRLVLFTELFIAGYPPEDLVLKPAFRRACRQAVEALAPRPPTAARA